jgi:MoaA/NifB/PqqE/SkfB family radical SAM enzyme
MFRYKDIRKVHLELSSECNASCPLCPRNVHGYSYNDGYVEHSLTLDEIKSIFSVEFIQQLDVLLINGNFGDFVMNPQSLPIINYFRQANPCLEIVISTNGGARNKEFWETLACLKVQIFFCLDGLEDTHSLYRINTRYDTVLNNAKTFIAAGGNAVWKFIKFKHNEHQVETAKALSEELGFKFFRIENQGRDRGPVYNKNGELTHVIGASDREFPRRIDSIIEFKKNNIIRLENVTSTVKKIKCEVLQDLSIYVDSLGDVYPCCYLGFQPRTYGHGTYMQAANSQVKPLLGENNAIKKPLEECMAWLNNIPPTWDLSSFNEGRLLHCNNNCGQ